VAPPLFLQRQAPPVPSAVMLYLWGRPPATCCPRLWSPLPEPTDALLFGHCSFSRLLLASFACSSIVRLIFFSFAILCIWNTACMRALPPI